MTDYNLYADNGVSDLLKGPVHGLVAARRAAVRLCDRTHGIFVVSTAPGHRIVGQVQASPYEDYFWTTRAPDREIVEYTLHKDGTLGRCWGPVMDNNYNKQRRK